MVKFAPPSIERGHTPARHPPERLLQNGLRQHVVLKGQEDSRLGGFSDGIMRTAQLHDEHLQKASGKL